MVSGEGSAAAPSTGPTVTVSIIGSTKPPLSPPLRIWQEHDDAVDAGGATTVRRGAVFERLDHAAETFLDFRRRVARDLERLVHGLELVVPDRAREDFVAVAGEVVLEAFHGERVALERLHAPLRPRPPKGATPQLFELLRSFKRQALHAVKLSIAHPITGEMMTWQAPIPDDMVEMTLALREDTQANPDIDR